MSGTYNPYLVGLSFLVAASAAFISFQLAAGLDQIVGARRSRWLFVASVVLGLGIWAVHFAGAFNSTTLVAASHDPWITIGSLLIAITAAYSALLVTTWQEKTPPRVALAGVHIGQSVAIMHYTGMASLQMHPMLQYRALPFFISVAAAIFFSWGSLWVALGDGRNRQQNALALRCIASLVMALGLTILHYAGVSVTVLSTGAIRTINSDLLLVVVCLFVIGGLAVTLILSKAETRFDRFVTQSNLSLKEANRRLQVLATVDTLTGVLNRRSFIEGTAERLLAGEHDRKPFSIMFLDLDSFKNVNDFLGHAAGDELLQLFVSELLTCIRDGDTVARLGGDEFIILLEGATERDDVVRVATAVLERMQNDFFVQGMALRTTVSMGIAAFPKDGDSVSVLLKNADMAMYDAKQRGKNTYCFFNPAMTDASARVIQIHQGLTEAIEKNQFTLVFQAKFGGLQNKLVGAEALIRWRHPEMGNLPPLDFIPIAEQTGLIAKISEWVIAETCRQMLHWKRLGLDPVKIAINLSPEQLRQAHYVDHVSEMIANFGITSDQIMFEVTENVAMREPAMAGEVIRQFQAAGFEIALDDFGIGYSSMAYLQQFRVKQLKIDRLFIVGLDDEGDENQAIVSAIIALAHSLHMTVVAEGVETMSQLQKLHELGCDQLQGYLLSRPLSAEHFETFLREQAAHNVGLALSNTQVPVSASASAAGPGAYSSLL